MVVLSLGGLLRRGPQEEKLDAARLMECRDDSEAGVCSDPEDRIQKSWTGTSIPSMASHQTRNSKRFMIGRSRSQLSMVLKWTEDPELESEPSGTLFERAHDQACTAKDKAQRELCSEGAAKTSVWRRRMLPIVLLCTLISSVVCTVTVHFAAVRDTFGQPVALRTCGGLLMLQAITLVCMALAALMDPGQLSEELSKINPKPRRSHKVWQFERRALRFDHYCRWLTNTIGLRNHREFFVMVIGLVANAVCGALLDAALLLSFASGDDARVGAQQVALLTHMVVLSILAYYAFPILRLHVGFISRNELAAEWKEDKHYVVIDEETGEIREVDELSPEEYDELYDSFVYDSSRNPWDRGFLSNCMLFWCGPRRDANQLGEF
jgi:hypothetical protein